MGTLITDRDQGLLDLLNAHPALRDRVEDLMQIVDDCEGTIEKADAAEQRIIEEVRKLGHAALTGWAERKSKRVENQLQGEPGLRPAGNKGRVENRLAPALPHQTVHAVFPHTAFRCSSCRGM
ncbi:MAG: hypothetical protein L0Y38_09270, partial [Methylococcaceae bacterium]|nr:hypothetical protein [Methylococcaceae bacterium]